ncbi:MAG: MmcQ/YjbR family DNA-binding protein [Rhizobiales bacterium]|jgi:hypothetical protein|nr:MmcQ/YjbR family DNA-binding protein [Hyphomicrobiales bacterium]
MSTPADVRRIALTLDGVSEIDHLGRPAYRTRKRIFAVMRADGLFLHLPDERKDFLFAAAPDVFVTFMWGKTANLIAQIERIPLAELRDLIHEAWQHASPAPKTSGRRHYSL